MNTTKRFARVHAAGRLSLCWLAAAFLAVELSAQAGAIRNLPGFNTTVYGPNDDLSYPCTSFACTPTLVPIGFSVTFYGNTYDHLFLNNNGNVTFDSALPTYTPFGLANTTRQIIAAFFADVDTRGGNKFVTFGNDTVDGHPAFGVNWIGVGYFDMKTDKLNSFQLVLIDRSDRHAGDFDIEFNYDKIRWETGDLSGGVGGLGGASAVVGFSNGSAQPGTSFQMAGSLVPGEFLDGNPGGLIHGSFNSTVPGRYIFPIVNIPDTVLIVPLFRQGDPPWADDTYDSSAFMVQNKGSALCTLAMALKYAGVNTDPGALNTALTGFSDFVGSGINWDAATRDASGGALQFHPYRTSDINYLKQQLGNGRPVIVGVERNTDGAPGHFVLVTGWQGGQFLINDPGIAAYTTLDNYNNDFETRGYVSGSGGNVSGLDLCVNDPADLLVVDPAGRRTGRSPISGVVEEISQSAHFSDAVEDDDLTGTPGSDTAHLVPIFQPAQGKYFIYVIGNKSGNFKLTLRSYAQNGTAQSPVTLEGSTTPGAVTLVQITLGSTGLTVNSSPAAAILTSFHSLTEYPDGASPNPDLARANNGVFYGTARLGGTMNVYGSIFRATEDGQFTTLYSFGSVLGTFGETLDGAYPESGLILDNDGFLYGTAPWGGPTAEQSFDGDGYGCAFMISTNGAMVTLYGFGSVLINFDYPLDGANPYGGLIFGRDGNFYGTTAAGGANMGTDFNGYGTVFKLTPVGQLTTLYSFGLTTNGSGVALDGAHPYGRLLQGPDGRLYGTTESGGARDCGTVFKVTTNGAFNLLYSFGAVTNSSGDRVDGANPRGGLIRGLDGNLYGTTVSGGTNEHGTIFRITTNGALTTLYSFSNSGNGANPRGALIQAADGNFYGSTFYGGPPGGGTVFSMTPAGALTSLYAFVGAADGARPSDGLLQGPDGGFYGTTSTGGTNGGGTLFRLVLPPPPPAFQKVIQTNGVCRFTWSAVIGRSYQVQYNTNLAQAAWSNLGSTIVATNSAMTTSDAIGSNRMRFYRVQLLP